MIRSNILTTAALVGAVIWAAGCQENSPLAALTGAAEAPARVVQDDPTDLTPMPPPTSPRDSQALVEALIEGLNVERAKAGLPRLSLSAPLCDLAEYHTTRMIDANFFSHVDPFDKSDVAARAEKFEYAFVKIGENLAAGQRSAREVLDDWLASPVHRANVLDPEFTDAGAVVFDGGRFGRYWTLELSRPVQR